MKVNTKLKDTLASNTKENRMTNKRKSGTVENENGKRKKTKLELT